VNANAAGGSGGSGGTGGTGGTGGEGGEGVAGEGGSAQPAPAISAWDGEQQIGYWLDDIGDAIAGGKIPTWQEINELIASVPGVHMLSVRNVILGHIEAAGGQTTIQANYSGSHLWT